MPVSNKQLLISEIFLSLQGETRSIGFPTIFIRLTGCPLRCSWCDTSYAFSGGKKVTIESILEKVKGYGVKHVTVTGGEPMAQKNCNKLLAALVDKDYLVSLETSGSIDLAAVDGRVTKIMDIKTPGSKESDKNLWANLQYLNGQDQLKLVIASREDYDWGKQIMEKKQLTDICEVIFSPVYGSLEPRQLADWIVEDALPVRFQMQLHKILWGSEPGR